MLQTIGRCDRAGPQPDGTGYPPPRERVGRLGRGRAQALGEDSGCADARGAPPLPRPTRSSFFCHKKRKVERIETSPREGRRVRRPIPDTERGRPRRGYIEDSSTAARVNRCTVLDCWPRRTPGQDACARSRPAGAYGALKIRQRAPKVEDRSSMTVRRTAGRPPHPALARTGPGGPGEQALRRRKPGAEPTSAL
jgi:hypothetical protein